MGLGIPPLKIKIMLESNPLKSIMLVRRLAVRDAATCPASPVHPQAVPPNGTSLLPHRVFSGLRLGLGPYAPSLLLDGAREGLGWGRRGDTAVGGSSSNRSSDDNCYGDHHKQEEKETGLGLRRVC